MLVVQTESNSIYVLLFSFGFGVAGRQSLMIKTSAILQSSTIVTDRRFAISQPAQSTERWTQFSPTSLQTQADKRESLYLRTN